MIMKWIYIDYENYIDEKICVFDFNYIDLIYI